MGKQPLVKPSKYRNVKTTVDNIAFDSAKEAKRWSELLLLARAGEIYNLLRQVDYPLYVERQLIGHYRCDFAYQDRCGQQVVEDVKGMKTLPLARWKHRHFEAQYGITVREIR